MGAAVRPAAAGDVPAIAALERECFSCPREAEEIGRSVGSFLIAEENGRFLGYIDCTSVLDEGYIGSVAVLPAERGRGVGETLLRALMTAAAERLSFLTLEVRESNTPARSLYEKMGFSAVAVRKNHYEKPREDAILMTIYFTDKEGKNPC